MSGQFPKLSISFITNGQIQLSLVGEAGVPHTIVSSSDLANWVPVATNADNSSNRSVTLALSADVSFYRASRNPIPVFNYALAVQTYIQMSGNGVVTDSWNSHDTNQSSNGYYSGYGGTNGSVASENGIVNIGNHTINGNLYLGTNAVFTGGMVAGTVYSGVEINFPDVALPVFDNKGNSITWFPAPGNSSSHNFTQSGFFIINDNGQINISPGITVTLDVKVSNYNPSNLAISGGTTNAGTAIMYQESGSLVLSGNAAAGAINNRPENFIYLGMSGVTTVTMSSSSTFVGVIYAPQSDAILLGGGSANNFIGSGIFNSLTVNGHYIFHFDQSLVTSGPCR
jgi:hypothetical protein